MYDLAGKAAEIAVDRAEKITESFLEKLEAENARGIEKAEDPDFQYALLTVQTEFARNGDQDLGDLLVDLLVDRTKHETRDILQIVLNESLKTAPQLTKNQLAVLALIFLFRCSRHIKAGNDAAFGDYLDSYAKPFIEDLIMR